ncbi:18S rRNA (guanine-N(7))-methyltransferase bud23 [Diplonema papillatum]|nr:18S rRNA (guanine-N(7))-methyltransferase bud23 [Diplonema papillatum]
MAAAPAAPAEEAPRGKRVTLRLFGEERVLAERFPAPLITDLLSVVRAKTRKPKRTKAGGGGGGLPLDAGRVAAVDAALRSCAGAAFGSVADMDGVLSRWKAAFRAKFDADIHYDGRRAAAYTEWNRGSQEVLTRRCLELAGLAPNTGPDSCGTQLSGRQRAGTQKRKRAAGTAEAAEPEPETPRRDDPCTPTRLSLEAGGPGFRPEAVRGILLDVGCGSGLSSAVAAAAGFTVVGTDLATAMLQCCRAAGRAGGGVVRADLREGLPLRGAAADAVVSVGALHFLPGDPAVLARFMREARRVLRPGAVFAAQFFPPTPAYACGVVEAAGAAGLAAGLVLDQPHRSNARRWFLVAREAASSNGSTAAACCLYDGEAACSLSLAAACAASGVDGPCAAFIFDPESNEGEESHEGWLWKNHLRYANKLARTCRHLDSGPPPEQASGASQGAGEALSPLEMGVARRITACFGSTAVSDLPRSSWPQLFSILHPAPQPEPPSQTGAPL